MTTEARATIEHELTQFRTSNEQLKQPAILAWGLTLVARCVLLASTEICAAIRELRESQEAKR